MPPVHSHFSSRVTPGYKMETSKSTMKHGMQTCNIKAFFFLSSECSDHFKESWVCSQYSFEANNKYECICLDATCLLCACVLKNVREAGTVHVTEAQICYQSFVFFPAVPSVTVQINLFRTDPISNLV
jgi:hypothetical protein